MFAKIAEFRIPLPAAPAGLLGHRHPVRPAGFGVVASPNVDVSAGGNVYKNAPYFPGRDPRHGFNVFFMLATTASWPMCRPGRPVRLRADRPVHADDQF
jgi:hypothetical protein